MTLPLPCLMFLSLLFPALQIQNDRSDQEGYGHDDYKDRTGLHAVGFHSLIQIDLYVGPCGTCQVSDEYIVAEDDSNRQQ